MILKGILGFLGRVLRWARRRVLVEDVELLTFANSLYFILRRAADQSVSILGAEVVDAIFAIWHFVQGKTADSPIAQPPVSLDLHGELSV